MLKKTYIVFLLIAFCFSVSSAQEQKLDYIQKLTISEGLAHNGVTSILEDSRGFLWFGTYDGINRYDGYELKTFKNTVDKDILTSNRVRSLSEDKKGNLWIGTDEGLTLYNYHLQSFKKIYSNSIIGKGNSGPIIRKIIVDDNKDLVLCLTQANGLLVFSQEEHSFINQFYPKSVSQNAIFFDGNALGKTKYLFTTSEGLLEFNFENKEFKRVMKEDLGYCNSIAKIDEFSYLLTLTNGVAILNHKINEKDAYQVIHKDLESYQFNSALVDTSNKLWLGTLNRGFIRLDNIQSLKTGAPYDLEVFNDDNSILRASSIVSTSHESIWAGTFNEGLYRFGINENPFKNYNTSMQYKYGLRSNSVTHIAPWDEDRVLLTVSLGGLALYNTSSHNFEPIPFKVEDEVSKLISAVFVDSKKNTWVRVNGQKGLRRYIKGKSKPDIFGEAVFINDMDVVFRSFDEDKYGNIWIGTNKNVYKIAVNNANELVNIESLNDNIFFPNNKLKLVRKVYADPNHNYIWIGTGADGLYRLKYDQNTDIKTVKISQYVAGRMNSSSLSSNFVTSIIRLPNNDFWIGTEGGGICKVLNSDSEPKFVAFTEKNGLSNNVVKNILYDSSNNLWIATNIGLNQFNPKNNEFRKFNNSDGLAFEDFWFAASSLRNNNMVFSGLDGFIYFEPNKISLDEKLPELQFENFKIFNETIRAGDTLNGRVILSKSISEMEQMTIKHNENVFSLDVMSLHFLNPKNHSLKYRLLPINDKWIEVPSNQKNISYSGLQSGTYKFEAMASNSLNDWTPPKTLEIIIKPSIWNTHLAYLAYTLLGLIIAYLIGRTILKIQALNHKVEIEHLEIDNVKQINEAKLRFFANISHELKTPLTLISRPLEVLSNTFRNNVDVIKKLNLMSRQSKKIQQLIEQVHDFRRADANLLKMDYNRFNFDVFIEELIIDFKFLADNDNKQLETEGDNESVIVSADRDKLEKIFNNLLNNAFKYTRPNDSIKIKYEKKGKDLIVSVIDTGRGIDSDDLEHVFERFYQSESKDNTHISGSGIGLAFSKRLVEMHYGFISADSVLNEGTTLTVRLPIVKKHLPIDVLEEIDLPKEKEVSISSELIQKNTVSDIKATGEFSESVIFYAEDNFEMRNYVSTLLSKFFKVKSFRNGKECLDAMEDEWPDIVISDVQMPEMNGLDLCLQVKSDLKTSHIPVILLTALTNIEDHLQGIRDGADAYIKKPFNVQHLITNTEALLTTRKQLRERYQIGIPLTKENNKNNRNDNAFLEKLYSLIEENLDNQDFDLNHLARELYLNRTHFYQKVKVLTNQTPFELLKMYRIKKAAELLIQKGLSVNEVYIMTGFKSRTHFAKVFKQKYSISPGKYAEESKKISHDS